MEYVGFVFGIFGLMAFLELTSLKGRLTELEREMTKMKGTSYHKNRHSLLNAAVSYIGQRVIIELKEDYGDPDIMMYGNTKHGSNTILDADEEWLYVRTESTKGIKDKLIRMEAVERITVSRSDEK